ncbi:hypothetical protein E2C01_028693 [Portunus trituberculatus]|uniref:Uncharacterized protein n=1 Tax=Portunus trituberculatus TaxID=210409 RepID=A0A5B7EQP4_PORTR|nr:hypothetical protein [Portunus trituberculatus]
MQEDSGNQQMGDKKWEENLRRKLCCPGVGNISCWSLVKDKQGTDHQESIPPLSKQDSTVTTSSKENTQLLASLFSGKIKLGHPQQPSPQLVQQCEKTVTMVEVMHQQVMRLLQGLDTQKATGPDDVSPHLLKRCSQELAVPLT